MSTILSPQTFARTCRLFAIVVLPLLLEPPATAQESDLCLECHSEVDLTGTRNGEEISVFVDSAIFRASMHGDLECVLCHTDLEGAEFHDEDVAPVQCGACHQSETAAYRQSPHGPSLNGASRRAPSCAQCHGSHDIRPAQERAVRCSACHRQQARDHARSLHGQAAARGDPLAPSCSDCHGGHEIRAASDPLSPTAVMNVPVLCGRCHKEGSAVSLNRHISQDRILENYSMSIHGEGLYLQGLTVTAVCTSCHTSHLILPHTDRRSSIHQDNVARTCERCHAQIEQVHRKVIRGHLWREAPDKVPACVDCHSPHKIRRVFYPASVASRDCLRCHEDPEITIERGAESISLYVDEGAYVSSEHGGTACAQCHTDVDPSLERPCDVEHSAVDCGICHAEVADEYNNSTHGTLHARGDPDAPYCLDCHEYHTTLGKTLPVSPTFAQNVPLLCAKCHRSGERAALRIHSEVIDIIQSYVDSIHGKGLLESGLVVTATCADCHSAHGELPPADERSTVHHDRISDTCGQCHRGISEIFKTSIHWPENVDTEDQLPTCNTCHTSHTIIRADLSDFRFLMMDQCGRCHETEANTFFDTFHGKVSRLGSAGAAKCYDCHGTHGILPSSNPESTLGRSQVVATCGQCHEGSHRRFAGYLTHATHHDPDKYPWLFWSFWAMTTLLVGTLGFALMHTAAWLTRLFLTRDEWRAHKELSKIDHKLTFERFTRFNRILHSGMIVSFFTLALTGMALKFSYMQWAQGVAFMLGGFAVMGALHRMGAIVLLAVLVLHLWDLRRRKLREGRSWRQALYGDDTILFTRRDLGEFIQSIRWFFGIGERPRYGRYTYWEKFDYFAVLWGIVIIGSTGLVLWLPELFTYILPGWGVNVATIIHSDEALLAVGFIFTIHFFNTHFRPDKFPVDPVIFTGRMTVDELRYDKPGEYDRLVESGELDDYLVGPPRRPLERLVKNLALVALAVGLGLIALIVYTMLFGYR